MSQMKHHISQFEGRDFVTLIFRGQPCWVARDFGRALGYKTDGQFFVRKLSVPSADEPVAGKDWAKLVGLELLQLRKRLPRGPGCKSRRAPHLIVLFESGARQACTETDRPLGAKLLRHLEEAVLPALERARAIDRRRPTIPEASSKELTFQAHALERTLDELETTGLVSKEIIAAHRVFVAELATGVKFPSLLVHSRDDWLSPTEIARRLGVTPQRVGLAISRLQLRQNIEGRSRAVINMSAGYDRTVVSYQYTEAAAQEIEEELRETGFLPRKHPHLSLVASAS